MRQLMMTAAMLCVFACWGVLGSVMPAMANSAMDKLTCPNAQILGEKLFSGVCWSCMFPIRVSGVTVLGGSSGAPSGAADQRVCACGGDLSKGELPTVGIPIGFWQPTRLIEIVRRPMCYPALDGTELPDATSIFSNQTGGNISYRGSDSSSDLGLYNFHYYSFPLMTILQIVDVPKCNAGGYSDIDVLTMSEAFPNWYNEELSMLVNPEVALLANPAALAAMPIDCISSTMGHGIDSLFWVAGCWGSMYPFTGIIGTNDSPVRGSSLDATRALAMLSRLGLVDRTVGNDVLCEPKPMPILHKSQYKMEMLFPVDEAEGPVPAAPGPPVDTTNGGTQVPEVDPTSVMGGACCHNIGASTLKWGEWRSYPATGEDFEYLLWQWTDCCMGVITDD